MNESATTRGETFAEAVRAEVARFGLEDCVSVCFVEDENVVRLTVINIDGTRTHTIEYAPELSSISPLLSYLRIEARLVSVHRARERFLSAASDA